MLMRSLVLAALFTSASHAQLIVGNTQSGVKRIYHVDVTTGAATTLFTGVGGPANVQGMAYDKSTNTLYWSSGTSLYSSAFSMSGLTPTHLGNLSFNNSGFVPTGLGFRNGNLVATRQNALEAVYTINPNSLAITQGYIYNQAYNIGGLDVDRFTNRLYGISDMPVNSPFHGLHEIDDTTPAMSFIAGHPARVNDIDGLAVWKGIAYGVTAGPVNNSNLFYIYDIALGQIIGTLPSPFTGLGAQAGAAIIPAPGAGTLIALGAMLAAPRRRRR